MEHISTFPLPPVTLVLGGARSPNENWPGSSGPGRGSGGRKGCAARAGTVPQGFSCGVRHAMKTRRPVGLSARRMLRKAATGSAKNMTPKREKTRS